MSVGTAGLTAMLCVLALERHDITPEGAGGLPVVVTGAAGGVGSVAVVLLAELGYRVVAVSGRSEHEAYLRRLGAAEVLTRSELADAPVRALDRQRWSGAVDAVGGTTLATVIRQTRYGGCVAACGLAGGADLADDGVPVHPAGRDTWRGSSRCRLPCRFVNGPGSGFRPGSRLRCSRR